MRLLITGGAGFIGSSFVKYMMKKYPSYSFIVLDKLTYAGHYQNISDMVDNERLTFVKGDICDHTTVRQVVSKADAVINFAAETHVDRSIIDAGSFVETDVFGTYVLLEASRRRSGIPFLQVSTDEVYGEVLNGSSLETDTILPRSPYAASKAGGELLARSYWTTYGLPVIITRGSNTFGPYQHPEKLIPVLVTNALENQPLPLYGNGQQIRDWLFVYDHCTAIDTALHNGQAGEIYNIGGGNERKNLHMAEHILNLLNKPLSLIKFVGDRPGHDRRYSVDCRKIRKLGWAPQHDFDEALAFTVKWYVENEAWWRPAKQIVN